MANSGSAIRFPARSIAFSAGLNNPLFQTRSMNSLSMDLLDVIKLVTLDARMPPKLVGSFKYVIHEYPADIDMFEAYVSDAKTLKTAGYEIAEKFANLAQNIKVRVGKDVYLGDFKAGVDERYMIDIGHIDTMSGKLIGYRPHHIREHVVKLTKQGLLTEDESDDLLRAVVDTPKLFEYMDLESQVRKKYVVRWTLDELIRKEKMLQNGGVMRLETAVTQKSIIKIDIWVRLQRRFIEVTNFYDLRYRGRNGIVSMNLEESDKGSHSYEMSLLSDLHHYSNPTLGKLMKLTKRLWLYAVLKKDTDLLHALYPLFGSGAAKMYQIMGEIETIENILQKVAKPVMKDILDNMEDWKARLGTVTNDILPGHVAHEIFKRINNALITKNKADINNTLDYVSEKLNTYINNYVIVYLKKNKVNLKKYISHNV